MERVRSSKLVFKGDPTSKKRKRSSKASTAPRDTDPGIQADSNSNTNTTNGPRREKANDKDQDENEGGWVDAIDPECDFSGPVLIAFSLSTPLAISSDVRGSMFASPLACADLNAAVPHDVRQVWVIAPIVETDRFSLKSSSGKYLSSDRYGFITAQKEAIGREEEWRVIPRDAGFVLQSTFDTFLGFEEKKKEGEVQIRGDATDTGFCETFKMRIQARFRKKGKAKKADAGYIKMSKKELEQTVGRVLSVDELDLLRKAHKEGTLSSTLLEFRVSARSDKFG